MKQKLRDLFPRINRRRARKIATKACRASGKWCCYSTKPDNFHAYIASGVTDPCWHVYVPWNDGVDCILRSSRVILVSKRTGEILFDGSAGDEG